MDSQFDDNKQPNPDDLYRMAVSAGVRQYTADTMRLPDTISKPLNPEEAFQGFLERLLCSDTIVRDLIAYCRASGRVIICSNSWEHEFTEHKRIGTIGGYTVPVNKTNYRFIALTGTGYRVCESILPPQYRIDPQNGLEQTPSDASVLPLFAKLNSSHLIAALKAGTTPERVIELLYSHANKLCPPD